MLSAESKSIIPEGYMILFAKTVVVVRDVDSHLMAPKTANNH